MALDTIFDELIESIEPYSNTVVTHGELVAFFKTIAQCIAENSGIEENALLEAVTTIAETYFKESEYRRMRDLKFFIKIISAYNHVSESVLQDIYTDWCTSCDELNRASHKQEE